MGESELTSHCRGFVVLLSFVFYSFALGDFASRGARDNL